MWPILACQPSKNASCQHFVVITHCNRSLGYLFISQTTVHLKLNTGLVWSGERGRKKTTYICWSCVCVSSEAHLRGNLMQRCGPGFSALGAGDRPAFNDTSTSARLLPFHPVPCVCASSMSSQISAARYTDTACAWSVRSVEGPFKKQNKKVPETPDWTFPRSTGLISCIPVGKQTIKKDERGDGH